MKNKKIWFLILLTAAIVAWAAAVQRFIVHQTMSDRYRNDVEFSRRDSGQKRMDSFNSADDEYVAGRKALHQAIIFGLIGGGLIVGSLIVLALFFADRNKEKYATADKNR